MAHLPQHPGNPCLLGDSDRNPAKIWELLRRNDRFRKAVARLEELDRRAAIKIDPSNRSPREVGSAMVGRLEETHSFAGVALQWLVPEPHFQIGHVAIPVGLDLTGRRTVPLVTVKLEECTCTTPQDKECWLVFEARGERDAYSIANLRGRPERRGPLIHVGRSEDPRLCDKVDGVQEWMTYFGNGRKFTVDTPWLDSPPQFKRAFCFIWRHLDSRATNPLSGNRIDAPDAHETHFFEGWSLFDSLNRGSMNLEDLKRYLEFDDLAKHHRVFAFPKSIRTRTEARRKAEWLFQQLCRLPDGSELPPQQADIFGTPLQWDAFLFAGNCNEAALFDAYKAAKPELTAADHVNKWRKERMNYIAHFRAIEHEAARIFPVKVSAPEL